MLPRSRRDGSACRGRYGRHFKWPVNFRRDDRRRRNTLDSDVYSKTTHRPRLLRGRNLLDGLEVFRQRIQFHVSESFKRVGGRGDNQLLPASAWREISDHQTCYFPAEEEHVSSDWKRESRQTIAEQAGQL